MIQNENVAGRQGFEPWEV